PCAGEYVTFAPFAVALPCDGCDTAVTLIALPSGSESFARTSIVALWSSTVLATSFTAFGGWLQVVATLRFVKLTSSRNQPTPGPSGSFVERKRTRTLRPAKAPRFTTTRVIAAAALPPVQALRPAIGLLSLGLMVPLYPPSANALTPTSFQVAPPSVLTSSTPPSKPSSNW